MWTAYKRAEAQFWIAEDINLSQDCLHWGNIVQCEDKHKFVSYMVALFVVTTGTVLMEIPWRFLGDIQSAEARAFYGFQSAMRVSSQALHHITLIFPQAEHPYGGVFEDFHHTIG